MREAIAEVGQIGQLTAESVRALFRRPFEGREILSQMYRLGGRSLPLVALTCVFTGAVMALQVSYTLAAYGAKLYVGSFVSLSMVKELGPVLTAVMLAARVGAGITAELGSMAVTEQVDAVRALGASPIKKLVLPRLAALMVMVPVLTVLGIVFGILGGLYIGVVEIGQNTEYFWSKVVEILALGDLLSGVGKTFFFAFFIGVIACHKGITARNGATGVGQATTQTVVAASVTIFISNFFLAKIFLLLQATLGGGSW